jgi:hypothetical protein
MDSPRTTINSSWPSAITNVVATIDNHSDTLDRDQSENGDM